MEYGVIALIGGGKAGHAILEILLGIPGVTVKYVCDKNPEAPALELARHRGIKRIIGTDFGPILSDPEVELIFELTGDDRVSEEISKVRSTSCQLVSGPVAKVIFYLLDAQERVADELRDMKLHLAERVIQRTEELAETNNRLKEQVELQRRTNDQLQRINDEKTKYLLNATHQLKAPFAAIQSYADLILEGFVGTVPGSILAIVRKIRARCDTLIRLIRRMLELANLKTFVEENLVVRSHHLADIVSKVLEAEEFIASRHHIELAFDAGKGDDRIDCNRDQVETLVQILVDNAVNYSDDGDAIEISICDGEGSVVLSVRDHGIGISEENLPKIFGEYFRSYEAAAKHENGSGLGLAIAKRIAEIHKGSIDVESELGEGTTFTVILPRHTKIEPAALDSAAGITG